MELEFHPLANEYPLLEGIEYEDFEQGILEAKMIREPIVLFEDKILDGRNRYRVGEKHGLHVPTRQYDERNEGPATLFVRNMNEHRRHEASEILRRRRETRNHRIEEARRNGQSLRVIAENEGMGEAQVRRILRQSSTAPPPGAVEEDTSSAGNSTAPPQGAVEKTEAQPVEKSTAPPQGAVEPSNGKVTGKDGRTRTAKPKRGPKPRGTKSTAPGGGAVEDGDREPGCDDGDFDAKDEERDRKRRDANKPKSTSKDAIGQAIPDCQKDVFGDTILPDSIAWLHESQAEAERLVQRLKRKITHYPFVLVKDVFQHLDEAAVALQCARESLEPGIPHVVCPKCKGKGCKVCRNGGHFPQWRFEELQDQETMA